VWLGPLLAVGAYALPTPGLANEAHVVLALLVLMATWWITEAIPLAATALLPIVAIPLMLTALLAMGVHSTFFGPIKYAILPQHLHPEEVLAGTGLVEAGTYISILAGTIFAGWIPVEWAALICIGTAVLGFITAQFVPPAPPQWPAVRVTLEFTLTAV
jgi:di/tricarboxylate transporter